MGLKDKLKLPKPSPVLFWRLGLVILVLLAVFLSAKLWFSGEQETKSAFADGRRLLIRIDNGDIEGRQIKQEKDKPAEKPPEAAAPDKPAETKPAEATPSTTPEAAPTPAVGQPPAASTTAQPAAVELAPSNPELTETASVGPLPKIGADGTKPWQYYAKPYTRKANLPMIAIIVTGLGQNKAVSESAAQLPEAVTLSFSPYAKDAATWVTSARRTGHEVMLDLPLEPGNYPASDPGPYGLIVAKGAKENDTRLQWVMSRFTGYVGFVTPQSESFSADNEAYKALLASLASRGLMLVVAHEPAQSENKQLLEGGTTVALLADLQVDEDLSPEAIQSRLTSLEQQAKARGYAIGIAQAYPVTVQQLAAWAAKLADEGYMLVPVSFIAKLKFS